MGNLAMVAGRGETRRRRKSLSGYCYAVFMRKHSRTRADARWGEFVEVKINIVSVLRAELARKRKAATAMLSSVCDPYQPAELRYRLTRGCVEALTERGWGVDILTRSPLVVRDIDIDRPAPCALVFQSLCGHVIGTHTHHGTDFPGLRTGQTVNMAAHPLPSV